MPFTVLLDEAMRRTRRHFRTIFPAAAIPLALLAAVTGALQFLWTHGMASPAGWAAPPLRRPSILIELAALSLMGIGLVTLQKAAVDATAGRPVDMKEAWRFALRGPVLFTHVLRILVILAALLACLVPCLYVSPLLSFVSPVMAEENVFGTAALSRSAALARYNPQKELLESPIVKTLALMFIAVVITYAVRFLVLLPFEIPGAIAVFRDIAGGKAPHLARIRALPKGIWLQVLYRVLSSFIFAAVNLYASFGYVLLFFDTRNRKDGSDLVTEIQTVFGSGRPSGAPLPGESLR
jgi:hypothetical protein